MDHLSVFHREERGVSIINLVGKITIGRTNRQVSEAIRRLADNGKTKVLLNLAKVTVIDSSGLGEIVAGFETMNRVGGVLRLTNLSQRITDLMTVTKLYTVFDVYESEARALQSFERDAPKTPKTLAATANDQ